MFTKGLRQIGAAIFLICGVSSAHASPVSYAFSGTLLQPYNGSSSFSGTLTYNTDLPPYPGIQPFPGWSYYSGVPTDPTSPVVSLNFSVGGVNSSSFGNIASDEVIVIVSHTQSSDAFYIQERFTYINGQNLLANFGMINNNLVQRAPFDSTSPPSSLNLADFSMGAQLDLTGTDTSGQYLNIVGTVTSLTPLLPTPIPEPASVLVFAIVVTQVCRSRKWGQRKG